MTEQPPAGAEHVDPELRALVHDPRHADPAISAYFGDAFPRVRAFAELLADQGVLRGLIGPRELTRLWERHILNSAAVVPFLGDGVVADVGSGAGLPGMVIAAMDPTREVILVEPMERRTDWLREAAERCDIANVRVLRDRAEQLKGAIEADAVTARAVAPIDRLVKWCAPLLRENGRMAFLKGRSAADEIDRAKYTLRRFGLSGSVHSAPTIDGLDATTVVVLERSSGA